MNPLLVVPATCIVGYASIDLTETASGWEEDVAMEIDAQGTCPWVEIQLPPGVSIDRLKAKTVLVDGTRHKLDGVRRERHTRDRHGWGAVRLHTPEVVTDDHVTIQMTRTWPLGTYRWSLDGAELSGALAGEESEGERVHPGANGEPKRWEQPAVAVAASLDLELLIPGEPMRSLYPGGGSSAIHRWTTHFPEADSDRAIVVPVPLDAWGLVVTGPYVQRDDSVLLTAESGTAVEHTVAFETPDAPTFGRPPRIAGAEVAMTVTARDAIVKWQGAQTWWLAGIDLRPVLPDRPRLIRALDNRFHRAAIPEPGIPNFLRGTPSGPELIAQLRPALLRRAGIGPLMVDPLFPRRLVKARRSGALSSVEAALTLWLQAGQAQLPASWALVRPASEGQGFHTSPAGYTHGLTAIQFAGGIRWIDPGCRMCAPFELRPELEGADMLSPLGYRSPEPAPGSFIVVDTEGKRTVELTGPAALTTRIWLASVESAAREAKLAERFGGQGAVLTSSKGIALPGAAISLTLELGESPSDPLDPALHVQDGWWGWSGERIWRRRDSSGARRHVHVSDLCWTQRRENEEVIETLSVAKRRASPESAKRLNTERLRPTPEIGQVDEEPLEH